MRQLLKLGIRPLLWAIIFAAGAASTSLAQFKQIDPTGILVQDNKIYLFTLEDGAAENARLRVSTDGGHTWKRRGPTLYGHEYQTVYAKDGKVWITGHHIREGPATAPFIMIPTEAEDHWRRYTICDWMSYIERIGWAANGEMIAWIREVDSGGDKKSLYVFHSLDGGRSWKYLGPARKHKEKTVVTEFQEIQTLKYPLW